MAPFDDEHIPLYTVGQVAQMLAVKHAFLRRIDEFQVVSPQRSAGGQRRYTRYEIRILQQVTAMTEEGMTLAAIRRIIKLERRVAELASRLAEVAGERDDLASRLAELGAERHDLARWLAELGAERDELARRLAELGIQR